MPPETLSINLKTVAPAKPPTGVSNSQARLAARCKPGHCNHKWKQGGGKSGGSQKTKVPSGFKAVALKDAYSRIGGKNSETVTGSDGKPARFSQTGLNHFKGKGTEKTKRIQSLDVAQDTVKTGSNFESYIPKTKIVQTEFIKSYGQKFFYTARRNDTDEVYSWHELSPTQFKRKQGDLKDYNANGTIK